MLSDVAICNLALGWVGGNQILSLTDDLEEAKICSANYDPARRALLETAAWTFAMTRVDVSPVETPPTYIEGTNWQAYLFPADALRVVRVTDPAERLRFRWEREGQYILVDGAAQVRLHYVFDLENSVQFTPQFDHALAARIAAEIAIPIAQSRELQGDMWGLANMKANEAMVADQRSATRQKLHSDALVARR